MVVNSLVHSLPLYVVGAVEGVPLELRVAAPAIELDTKRGLVRVYAEARGDGWRIDIVAAFVTPSELPSTTLDTSRRVTVEEARHAFEEALKIIDKPAGVYSRQDVVDKFIAVLDRYAGGSACLELENHDEHI